MTTHPAAPDTELDIAMNELAAKFAAGFSALSSSPVFRPYMAKAAIMHAAMAVEDHFPDCKEEVREALREQSEILELADPQD